MFLRSRLCALALLVSVSACAGVTSVRTLPDTAGRESTLRATPATTVTHLWTAACYTCGIAGEHDNTLDVTVYDAATGAQLKQLQFDDGLGNQNATAITSPNQQHVYVSIIYGHVNYVADIDPSTYAVRYYRIPIAYNDGGIIGLYVSPDGTRLYVPTYVNTGTDTLYVINTVSRTYAAEVPATIENAALSPDGTILYAQEPAGLTAIYTSNYYQRHFARDPGALAFAVSPNTLYVSTDQHIDTYAIPSLALTGYIARNTLPERLAIDNAESRLFAWNDGPTSQQILTINTASGAVLNTVSGVPVGPQVDPITHAVYEINSAGNICAQTPPSYAQTCTSSEINTAALPFSITTTN